jgi:hypothetical protein
MMALFDSVSRESVDPIKMLLIGIFSALLIYTSFETNSITYFPLSNGKYGWDWNGNFKITTILITSLVSLMWLYYCAKIYLNTPKRIKRNALELILGAHFLAIIPMILVITNLNLIYFGCEAMSMGLGALICAYEFARQPKLMFILPFKVLNLTVINTNSGIPLYKYNWDHDSEYVDEMLFSAMLQGISMILKEAVHKGDVKEIRLTHGILLLYQQPRNPIVFVLVASKSSKILHDALKTFGIRFTTHFKQQLNQVVEAEQFLGAEKIIQKYFSFIP